MKDAHHVTDEMLPRLMLQDVLAINDKRTIVKHAADLCVEVRYALLFGHGKGSGS
jgi:hypothetical protein